ncbi:hypothetical protein Tsubulata_028209 [Turnera subulata]|uniref:Growth-regulating factor n=1 Tax=Turnera subulata TaxID=218843 RepID=A0A9Q0J9F9_9ROSI|nr:hypothetical protein Tsubulata_028209 [Turnera subulata]
MDTKAAEKSVAAEAEAKQQRCSHYKLVEELIILLSLQLSGKSLNIKLSYSNTWSQVSLSHLNYSILSKEAWNLLWPQDCSLTNRNESRVDSGFCAVGWGCFQVGFGRKADPEPGRCRRTDGKKWRCSKEAYPDSKYCEKHMHRGRNRSRKPVELTSAAVTPTALSISRNLSTAASTTTTTSPSTSSYSFSQLSSSVEPEIHAHQSSSHGNLLHPFFHSHSSSARPSGFSPQNSTTHQNLFMDSGSSSQTTRDYRSYLQGAREDMDGSTLYSEASGSGRSLHDSYQQLPMSCYEKVQSSPSQFQRFSDDLKQRRQQEQYHCFVLGTDIKSSASRSAKLEKITDTEKPLHQFFGEWSPKDADSWLDLASSSRMQNGKIKQIKCLSVCMSFLLSLYISV